MRRFVAIMAVLLLMLSHGSMGEAAPYHGGHDAHAAQVADNDAHHVPVWHDAPGGKHERAPCQIVHVHNVIDLARVDSAVSCVAVPARLPFATGTASALGSRAVAPLLEPPAA